MPEPSSYPTAVPAADVAVGDVIHFAEGPATVAHVHHEGGRVRLRLTEGSLAVPPEHQLLVSRPH